MMSVWLEVLAEDLDDPDTDVPHEVEAALLMWVGAFASLDADAFPATQIRCGRGDTITFDFAGEPAKLRVEPFRLCRTERALYERLLRDVNALVRVRGMGRRYFLAEQQGDSDELEIHLGVTDDLEARARQPDYVLPKGATPKTPKYFLVEGLAETAGIEVDQPTLDASSERVFTCDGEMVDVAEDYLGLINSISDWSVAWVGQALSFDSVVCVERDESVPQARRRLLTLTWSDGAAAIELEGGTDWVDSHRLILGLNDVLARRGSARQLHELGGDDQCLYLILLDDEEFEAHEHQLVAW